MRFQTKFDRGLVIVLVTASLVTLALPWIATRAPRWIAFGPWVIWAYVFLSTLPQYYDLLPEGLRIRQGVRKALIPYEELVEVTPVTESRSAGVYSFERVQVVTRERGTFLIAPRDQTRFLEEVARHAPQLRRKGVGLAVTF